MKIGICAWVLPGEELASFRAVSDLGLDGVVIDFGNSSDDVPLRDPQLRRDYREIAEELAVEIPTLAFNLFCNRGMMGKDNESYAGEVLLEGLEYAKELGIATLHIPSFFDNAIASDEDLERTIAMFRFICAAVEGSPVSVATENVLTIEQHRRLYEGVAGGKLSTVFDTQNPWRMMNQDGLRVAQAVSPWVSELHAKDSYPNSDSALQLGEGDVDFMRIMDVFRDSGFDGWIHLESQYDRMKDREVIIRKDMMILKELFSGRSPV